jgi:hypothetical protein
MGTQEESDRSYSCPNGTDPAAGPEGLLLCPLPGEALVGWLPQLGGRKPL